VSIAGNFPVKKSINIDEIVKSRHSGENRSPDYP